MTRLRLRVHGLRRAPEPFLAQLLDGLAAHGVSAVRRGRADVAYVPWSATAVEHPEVFAAGVPVLVSCRGAQVNVAPWNPDRRSLREGLPLAFQRAASVHCVSEAIRAEAERFGLDPSKAVVIPPAVDLRLFAPGPTARAPRTFRLVSVGRVIWRKGYEYALLAVRQLLDAGVDVRYEVVGEEADGWATRHAVHDLGLTDRVTLTPPRSRRDVAALLRDADALILPSVSEGIANAALEAMACARPVVVTDCGGMREAVDDGVEGFVVPVRDPDALAVAVRRLAEDPARASAMGVAGRRRVEVGHDLDDQVTAFASLVRSLT